MGIFSLFLLVSHDVKPKHLFSMKLTIIYDNTTFNSDLTADWGFAALVEAHGRKILFDTGGDGEILLTNMQKLGIHPAQVDEVFISHAHFDHVGGLSHFLRENHEVAVYVPDTLRGIRHAREVKHIDKPGEIHEHFYTTGELDHIEQSLLVETGRGLVLVAGCSHPPMDHILSEAGQFGKLYGIIGGLHGFNEFELFNDLQLVCPTHCTQHIEEIKRRFPEKYLPGGTGKIIEI